jgi:SAM-dependent methyltransferase
MRARLFARYYDRVLSVSEEAGLAERRASLLARASGRTLELGAGTGLNLDHYPDGLESLVMTEPDRLMAQRLRAKVAARPRDAFIEIATVGAESLPFPDQSFDTVVSTLVLCTVPDPEAALGEAHRVLRPGGQFLFLEHVLGEGAVARRQRLVAGPWAWVACGCRCDRPTASTISGSNLELVELEEGRMPKATKFLKPLIQGRAVRPAM